MSHPAGSSFHRRRIVPCVLTGLLSFGALTGSITAQAASEPTVLITGSSRGIGLELARQYAERGWNVIATCRTPARAADLQAIAADHDNLVIEELDVTDFEEVGDFVTSSWNGEDLSLRGCERLLESLSVVRLSIANRTEGRHVDVGSALR